MGLSKPLFLVKVFSPATQKSGLTGQHAVIISSQIKEATIMKAKTLFEKYRQYRSINNSCANVFGLFNHKNNAVWR
jgi:hypothetical protein